MRLVNLHKRFKLLLLKAGFCQNLPVIPLSLYIHIPWCEKKCPYCDFNSHLAKSEVNEPAYVQALLDDLSNDLDTFQNSLKDREVSSIFIGGGTPSLFSAVSIESILKGVAERISLSGDIEVTLEANPGSAEASKFAGFKQGGVNRLSIGVQSFNDEHLSRLGRIHNSGQARQAISMAQAAGFDNFNLDLMYGLPDQSQAQCLQDLAQALALSTTHLSCYQLTIEPNTLFHHAPPPTPDDEALWDMQLAIQSDLADQGFRQYEVSAYSQAGKQCRHNVNYWQFGDYLGIGAGAHGKISDEAGCVTRYWKVKHPATYLSRATKQQSLVGDSNPVAKSELSFEFMMNALRLSAGFSLNLFEQRTGLNRGILSSNLDRHLQQKLITISQDQIELTKRGKAMINSMLEDYLPGQQQC